MRLVVGGFYAVASVGLLWLAALASLLAGLAETGGLRWLFIVFAIFLAGGAQRSVALRVGSVVLRSPTWGAPLVRLRTGDVADVDHVGVVGLRRDDSFNRVVIVPVAPWHSNATHDQHVERARAALQ